MRKSAIATKNTLPAVSKLVVSTLAVNILALAACTQAPQTMVTIADARNNPAQIIDTGESGDSMGDILVFDQPLLDKDKNFYPQITRKTQIKTFKFFSPRVGLSLA